MTLNTRTLIVAMGASVWASADQAATLNVLIDTRKGGFARIMGYIAPSGRIVPTVYDATVTTRFSYKALVERKRKALVGMTLAMVKPFLKSAKVDALTPAELAVAFDTRKAKDIASFTATGNDDRSDSHRQGHDRCYLNLADGIVVHYVTERNADDGLMHPVLLDGFPMVDSIMLNCLEVSRNVREAGTYKVVNSGVDVLIGNAIKAAMKAQGVRSMNRISLKEGNFERLAIDTEVVLPEDIIQLAEAA